MSKLNSDQITGILNDYGLGMGLIPIAKKYSVTPTAVRYVLVKRGVKMRRRGRPKLDAKN